MKTYLLLLCVGSLLFVGCAQAKDVLVADFEGADYGDWEVTGDAFGTKPATGTWPRQAPVTGFQGKGLVNTYMNGDGPTGTLTSPEFKIERDYLVFVIGGGSHKETCIELLVDGKAVASCSGNNDELLEPNFFDVKKYKGQTVRLRLKDLVTGGWGHINLDHIVQSDLKPDVIEYVWDADRTVTCDKRYLLIPIQNGAKKAEVNIEVDGVNVREFDAEIAASKEDVSFWSFLDLTPFADKKAVVHVSRAAKEGFELIATSDEIPGSETFYTEPLRPQFHFSQMVGWNNDTNGMVYYDGEWHMYFQHNPYGWDWGNMHWGHAVSNDLVHWEQLPIAIYNKKRGDWAFSGSAVVDKNNTGGWQTGDEKVIVAAWTSTGRGECIAYSNDRGRTFTEYEGNPVVRHSGRDPKVFWYKPGNHWVMALYDEGQPQGRNISFYTSDNLKDWQLQSRVPNYYECPEFFELPVDGDKNNTRWVLIAADAHYALGSFDGKTFTPEHEGKHRYHYGHYYASQLFNNAPDGRRIQVGWARIDMPGMPFNQTFSFPHELSLRTTSDGIRLFAEPVKEIKKPYGKTYKLTKQRLADNAPASAEVKGELFDIKVTFDVGDASEVGLDIGGEIVAYHVDSGKLYDAPIKPVDGKVTIQVLVDRPMIEVIGNNGRVYITLPRNVKGNVSMVKAFSKGGSAKLVNLEINEMKSIWK